MIWLIVISLSHRRWPFYNGQDFGSSAKSGIFALKGKNMPRAARVHIHEQTSEDYENVVEAARLFYVEGLSQARIGQTLKCSQSTVSRLLERAKHEGLIHVRIEAPPLLKLRQDLEAILGPRGVRMLSLAPGSNSPKNLENLGIAGSRVLAKLLEEIPKPTIRLVVACGDTLLSVMESFFDLLAMEPGLLDKLEGKRLELYPTMIHPNTLLDAIYPHTLVSLVTHRATTRFDKRLTIEGHVPSLPMNFYTLPKEERNDYRDKFISETLNAARDGDIFLLGLGVTDRDQFRRIQQDMGLPPVNKKVYVAEANYIPIRLDGTVHKAFAENIVGLTINDFKKASKDSERHVMIIGGGASKGAAFRAATAEPFFNIIVTDSTIARELVSAQSGNPN